MNNKTDIKIPFWEDKRNLELIKNTFGKNLNKIEYETFVEMGKASNLNPFLKEIWAIKFANNPAQIFLGRDGYRKFANKNNDYDGHTVTAIYSNDTFKVVDGRSSHEYSFKDRGDLIGARAVVYRKSKSVPSMVDVYLEEYKGHPKSLWGTKPETMIKKVAEAQALRMSFPDELNGTYSEFEMWDERQKAPEKPATKVNIIELMIERLHDLGATDNDIAQYVEVEDIKGINETHKDQLIQFGKRLKETISEKAHEEWVQKNQEDLDQEFSNKMDNNNS